MVKTKQKQVLHLYVGSKILLAEHRFSEPVNDRVFTLGAVIGNAFQVEEMEEATYRIETFHDGDMRDQLILRPLSDMTNDEEKEAYKLEFKTDRKEEEKQEYFWSVDCWLPETFVYLLKRGFDLFGLIESGQAIDKTKPKASAK